MREYVRNTIAKHKMFAHGDNVVVGLSGGADSVALLHVLLELRDDLGIGEIIPVHINHNLRGEESTRDENFSAELCKKLNLPLKIYQANVKAFAVEKNLGIEEAARILRYSLMEEAVATFNAQKIAMGHHQDDNAETVLMNLCRGAGLRGLCGIPPVNGRIIRPLIETSRAAIENYLTEIKIPFITDATNNSNDHTRNRIRNNVIPLLTSQINPNAPATIARNAMHLRTDLDFLDESSKEAYTQVANANTLDISKLKNLHPALSQRVVRHAIAEARGSNTDISATHVTAVLDLAFWSFGERIHIPGLVVKKEYNTLIFTVSDEQPAGFCYPLQPESSIYIPEINKTVTVSLAPPDVNHYCTKAFNYDMVDTTNSYIRTRQPGDRITLSNKSRKFTKKLQDYFTDAKIPASQRSKIPLIAVGNEIIWIMDKQNRINAKYTENTGKLIWITLWE